MDRRRVRAVRHRPRGGHRRSLPLQRGQPPRARAGGVRAEPAQDLRVRGVDARGIGQARAGDALARPRRARAARGHVHRPGDAQVVAGAHEPLPHAAR